MFPLGLRLFHSGKMIYTTDFSIITNRSTRIGLVTISNENELITSDLYMMVTNASASNGDVYEYDILQDMNGNLFLVVFDFINGRYVGVNGDNYIDITSKMFSYEILGNPIETPELMARISFPCEDDTVTRLMALSEDRTAADLEDKFVMVSPETVDFDDDSMTITEEITEEEKQAMNDFSIDIEKLYDNGKVIQSVSLDITDEYVEWVYKQYLLEMEQGMGKEEDFLRYDDQVHLYFAGFYDDGLQKGSYSIHVECEGEVIEYSNILKNATDQKSAELQAILNALRVIKSPSQIQIYSLSKYVVYPFTKRWIYDWERNQWKKKPGEGLIKNHAIFSKILELVKIHDIEFNLYENPDDCIGLKNCIKNAQNCFFEK